MLGQRTPRSLLVLSLVLAGCGGTPSPSPAPASTPSPTALQQRLETLPGLTVARIETLAGFSESFQVDIRQPVDHDRHERGSFSQRFLLSHRGEDRPTVFYTSGYGIARNFETEISALVQGNQILLVHRFFPNATPEPADWSTLTIRQAAEDQHLIRETLRPLYSGRWVSTGGSKGGMAALFYRRFHPADVDATVAFVAPMPEGPDDPRFVRFLHDVGAADCRARLAEFQRQVLVEREVLLPRFRQHSANQGYRFSLLSDEAAYEYSVLEYPFAFWQYGHAEDCATVPGTDATDQQLVDHLVAVSPPSYYADAGFLFYQPLFYQAYTQLGYCTYDFAHLEDLLVTVPQPTYRAFAPRGVPLVFDPEALADVTDWLRHEGQQIAYIYGGNDPWTAGALQPDRTLDALLVVQPGANHRIQIAGLDRRAEVLAALERWLSVRVDAAALAVARPAPDRERF